MFCILCDWCATVNFASRVFEIKRIQKLTAKIALITMSIRIATKRAFTFNEAIRQKRMMLLTVQLGCYPLL